MPYDTSKRWPLRPYREGASEHEIREAKENRTNTWSQAVNALLNMLSFYLDNDQKKRGWDCWVSQKSPTDVRLKVDKANYWIIRNTIINKTDEVIGD